MSLVITRRLTGKNTVPQDAVTKQHWIEAAKIEPKKGRRLMQKRIQEIINDGLRNIPGSAWTHSQVQTYKVSGILSKLVVDQALNPKIKELKREIKELKQEKMRILLGHQNATRKE